MSNQGKLLKNKTVLQWCCNGSSKCEIEVNSGVDFINILCARFVYEILAPKNYKAKLK